MGFEFPSGGGGNAAGAPVVRKFPFAFDTPNLLTGAAVYTPTIGEVLLDAWFEIDTAWNGTTPLADIGTFVDQTFGLFIETAGGVDMTRADALIDSGGPLIGMAPGMAGLSSSDVVLNQAGYAGHGATGTGNRVVPAKFSSTHSVKIVVSQDGTVGGADPGSTQGAAILYLVTATPV